MGHATSYGTKGTEQGVVIEPRRWARDGSQRGLIYSHSHGNLCDQALAPGYVDPLLLAAAEAGVPSIATDLSGGLHWGIDAAQTKMGDALTALGTAGAKTDKCVVFAFSMGALVMKWVRDNASKVAGFVGVCPAVDLADLHDNRGYGTEINSAYGSLGAYQAALPSKNPLALAADPVLQAVPMRIYYGTADAVVVPSTVAAFAAAHGNCVTVAMPGAAHDPTPLPVAGALAFVLSRLR